MFLYSIIDQRYLFHSYMINVYSCCCTIHQKVFNYLPVSSIALNRSKPDTKTYYSANKNIISTHKLLFTLPVFLLFFLSSTFCSATITIHSITPTESTCGNNGTATVAATSSKSDPSLFFEIIAGPATAPIQNNPVFSSLFPGTYTLRVYDIDFLHKDATFTISGNYTLPDMQPITINPLCPGATNGMIVGHAVTGTGRGPFTWEITSPFTSQPQSSDSLKNLPEGTYTIRMTDACLNYQTRTAVLVTGGTGLSHFYDGIPSVQKLGCDTVAFSMQMKLFKEKAKMPLKLSITTNTGVYTKYIYPSPLDTISFIPAFYEIRDTIPGITYNTYMHATITDTCGYSIYASRAMTSPFEFDIEYSTIANCGNKLGANLRMKNPPYYPYIWTAFKAPLTITLKDVAANTTVDSSVCDYSYCSLQISPQVSGRTYQLKVTDGCGNVYLRTIVWPVIAPPRVEYSNGVGCMDSTAAAYFNIFNFTSSVTFTLLSGPSSVKSSKHKYEFSDVITYPKTFKPNVNNGLALKNLPAGTYTYTVFDTCGNVVNGSFTVLPIQLADFNYSYKIKRGCLGDNMLYFDARSSNTIGVYVKNVATDVLIYQRRGFDAVDSIPSVPPGKYVLSIYYGYDPMGGGVYDGTVTDNMQDCWHMDDTITVFPYSSNVFKSNTTIFCNGTSYVELNVDSTRGVPPYQFEIVSGPQTFPLQNSNVFQLPTYGNYLIRIRDACGNSNSRQISVDSAKFPPVIKKGISCTGSRIVLKGTTSTFFAYEWQRPNGTIYTGDSLVIDPLSAADTGTYLITKKVTINGCTDFIKSTYRLQLHDMLEQTIPFCIGTPIHVGTSIYTLPGIYRDTLQNVLGCDSVIITTLKKIPQKVDTSTVTICKGDHLTVGTNTYTTTGIYKDSVQNVFGCYDLTITKLFVNGIPDTIKTSICTGFSLLVGSHLYTSTGIYTDTLIASTGCDSIVVHDLTVTPYPEFPVAKTICAGESFAFLTHTYTQAGIYRDTIQSASCKNIIVLTLTVNPYKKDSIVKVICEGEKYSTGGRTYIQTGIYRDTVSTSGCDSITIVNLTVLPLKRNTLVRSICEGQSVTIGTHSYKQTGIYKDTLATAGCDSIVTLDLTVHPFKRNMLSKTICAGESIQVGLHIYNQTGIYADTLATTGCDSIVILNLTVTAPPDVSLGKDTSLCTGASLVLQANTGYAAYYWNDNVLAAASSITVTAAGKYWVNVQDQFGCTKNDTMEILHVYPLPTADAGPNTTACYGESIQLSAGGGISYVWMPGNMQQATVTVSPLTHTTYRVTVTDINHCSASDDVTVTVYPKPASLFSAATIDHCFDEGPTALTANWGQSFLWLPSGEITQTIQVAQEGIYTVTATDVNHCSYSEQISLRNICETKIFVPTGFTPNGDGLHDDVEIFGKNFTNFKITIFNRWGEIIFISTDREIRWNGMYRGEEMPIGSYPWIISYESIFDTNHTEQKLNGSITLVR